jgi:hypothetical protein
MIIGPSGQLGSRGNGDNSKKRASAAPCGGALATALLRLVQLVQFCRCVTGVIDVRLRANLLRKICRK